MDLKSSIDNDLIENNKFEIINNSIINSNYYSNVLTKIYSINKKTNWINNYDDFESRKFEYPFCLAATKLSKNMNVADMGCSLDPFSILLLMEGCNTYGLDIISSHDESWDPKNGFRKGEFKGKKKFDKFKEHINKKFDFKLNIKIQDMSSTNFENNYLDRIFCISVLEHLPKYKIIYVLNEWKRILKDDGKIILTIDYILDDKINFNIGEILENTGFQLINNIRLIKFDKLVVAGFVISPIGENKSSIISKIYRRNFFVRKLIDFIYKILNKI